MRLKNTASLGGGRTLRRVSSTLLLGGLLALAGTLVAASPAAAKAAPSPSHGGAAAPAPGHDKPAPGTSTGPTFVPKPHVNSPQLVQPATAFTLSLTASSNVVWTSQSATVTATTNVDVGPTPYFIRIYDASEAGSGYVATCGTGTTCSVTVAYSTPVTVAHNYTAYVSDNSTAVPPGSVQARTSVTQVVWRGVQVQLAASPTTLAVGGTAALVATASSDVGPSPLYIQIFDANTGTMLANCGGGTLCSTTVSQSSAMTRTYWAYITTFSTAFPPTGVQYQSLESAFVTWTDTGDEIHLSGPDSSSGPATYTAIANLNVGPTPYYIDIYNETTGTRIARCGSGSSCSVQFQPTNGYGSRLIAFIESFDTTDVQASSNVQKSILPIRVG